MKHTADSLASLNPGESAIVLGFGALDDAFISRFKALGFVPGHTVHCIRRAAFRGPVEYDVQGTRVAIRRTDAAQIQIESTQQQPSNA